MGKASEHDNEGPGAKAGCGWDPDVREKFRKLIDKVPVFLRGLAEQKVARKAESLARQDNRALVCEKDLVDAFFIETPFGFHGPMKSDMDALQIDYARYGHAR